MFCLHPDIICLTNSTAVPGLINGNLLTDHVLDVVLSFDQSNVSIVTDGFCTSMADETQRVKRPSPGTHNLFDSGFKKAKQYKSSGESSLSVRRLSVRPQFSC